MRSLITILIIVALLGFIVYMWATRTWNKITFAPPTLSEGLSGLTMATISGQTVSLPLTLHIVNGSNYSIPFSSIKAQLSYGGIPIAETTDMSSHVIPANSSFDLINNVDIDLNSTKQAALALLTAKLQGAKPSIDYSITAKVYGIPLPVIKNSFIWGKSNERITCPPGQEPWRDAQNKLHCGNK